ncbi:MAG: hypothetical protein GPOALKHO_001805 [Sodalis sp.]|nr:MAG: hypothetical protein GPOALKHO_001805 [Sodalis sp.]
MGKCDRAYAGLDTGHSQARRIDNPLNKSTKMAYPQRIAVLVLDITRDL